MSRDDADALRPAEQAGGIRPDEPALPAEPRPMAPAVRWLARLAVVALALRFIVQGFERTWSGADELAAFFLVATVVLVVAAAGYALVEVARRGREG